MNELSLFADGFMRYLVTYIVFIVAIVAAFLIGFALRKNKNSKEAADEQEAVTEEAAGKSA
ncbi:MAG: hypothetical protein K5686_11195 [Lachnospiraceae bacterium]|nr:hypothetical protein [Lachnospiraceae bacterium]